nr:MAG: putative RNA-dependent RNA polymerase [Botourmiaviridae sp.]
MLSFEVGNCYSHCACVSVAAAERVNSRFTDFCTGLNRLFPSVEYRFRLPEAKYACPCSFVKYLKKFCGGLIEGNDHEWRVHVHRLSRRQRFSIAASLFLFRKVIPSPGVDLDAYMDKMSTPSPSPDPEFALFCEEWTRKLFPVGWDRNYTRLPERVIPSRSSCLERGMGKGGQRALIAEGDSWINRQTFCEFVLYSSRALKLRPSRVVSVETGGKNRIVSTPTIEMNVLRPLHIAMYDRLSRFPWLLRGDAKPSRFKDFHRVRGEVFVSGDYESATDNLNSHIQETILRNVCEQGTRIPPGVRDTALSSLHMQLTNADGSRIVVQNQGQLMGNLLSFPLLCIVNYLAFRFFVRRRGVPVKINGDDIVFRATRAEAEKWMDGVGRSGLTLSPGKTLVNDRFFSLNSRFFDSGRKVRLVPVVRAKPFFWELGRRGFINPRSTSCLSRGLVKGEEGDHFRGLSTRESSLYSGLSRRSVINGLGISCPQSILERVDLFNRERCYLDVDRKRFIPETPVSESLKAQNPYNLEGWRLERRELTEEVRAWQKEHADQVLRQAWISPIGDMGVTDRERAEEIRRRIRDSGTDYSEWISSFRRKISLVSRMTKISRNEAWRRLNPYVRLPTVHAPPKVVLYYCPDVSPRRQFSLSSMFVPAQAS